jgi:hypothetical protein
VWESGWPGRTPGHDEGRGRNWLDIEKMAIRPTRFKGHLECRAASQVIV